MAFPERPLRGRVELPVQWIVNGDGSVSFHILFLSSIHICLGFVFGIIMHKLFYHYSILHAAPQTRCFLWGCLPYLIWAFIPVSRSPRWGSIAHASCGTWELASAILIFYADSTADCRRILPCHAINSKCQHSIVGQLPGKLGAIYSWPRLTSVLLPSSFLHITHLDHQEPQALRRHPFIHSYTQPIHPFKHCYTHHQPPKNHH